MDLKSNSKLLNSDAIIWTEGKTDWKHLKKAIEKLNLDLNISFHEYEDKDMGEATLLKKCETFAETPHTTPIIFVFDNDNKDIVEKVNGTNKEYKDWGNNVFSFAIPVPSHRKGYENICIEMYYTDDEIRAKDSNGRRVFLTSEFKASGTYKNDLTIHIGHKGKLKNVTEEKKTKIVDSEVYKDEKNIALSKSNFANYIYNDISPFSNFNFEEFRKIFDIVVRIIQDTTPKINVYFSDVDEFFKKLKDEKLPSQQLSEILDNILNLLKITLYLFIVTTIRYYEDAIIEEPRKYKKKVRPIKKIITENFREPSLLKIRSLAEKCYYLVDQQAPKQLLNMKECLVKSDALGTIAQILNDVQKIFPDNRRGKVIRASQSVGSLIKQILPEFSEYETKLPLLAEEIDNNKTLNISIEVWQQALKAIITLVSPILSLSNTFTLRTLEQVDTTGGYYIVNVTKYSNGKKEILKQTIDFENFEEWQDRTSELIIEIDKHNHNQISINLFPFLKLKDDHLYFYRRTRAVGYEYHSVFGNQVSILPTKKKFNHSVFRTAFKGDQQALFWTDVIPSVNPVNNIKANIPIEELEGFVGRKKQIEKIMEEIIEIPNQNGIIYGPGGVGKTVLMIEISRQLLEEKNIDKILFDNIIWVSAKSDYYTYTFDTVEKREQQFESLDNIFSVILKFFEYEDIEEYEFEDKRELALDLLKENKILLVLDNFETISKTEAEKIIKFFGIEVKKHLRKKPDFFKVIVTSRKQIPSGFHQIELKGLDIDESKQLMRALFQKYKNSSLELTDEQQGEIHNAACGIPIIIKHCFGRIFEFNQPLDVVINGLYEASNEVIKFSFAEIFKLLKEDECQLEITILLETINSPLLIRQIADILERSEFEVKTKIPMLIDFQCIKRASQRREEKYLISDEVRFFTRGLTQENTKLTQSIRQRMIRNFTIEKQMDYTTEELGVLSIFDNYLLEQQYLEAEDFIKEHLKKKPESVLLNFHYAKYLKERKRKINAAIEILENIRKSANNHPTILRLLVSCYTSFEIPNYSGASAYVSELEKVIQDNEDLKIEIAEFYVKWSTHIKMNRELDPLKEVTRQQRYKDFADNAISILSTVKNKTHKICYLLAQSYFNKWDYKNAFTMINKAITPINQDPRYYSSYAHLRKLILRKQEQFSKNRNFLR